MRVDNKQHRAIERKSHRAEGKEADLRQKPTKTTTPRQTAMWLMNPMKTRQPSTARQL
jgi:hypothetical protein